MQKEEAMQVHFYYSAEMSVLMPQEELRQTGHKSLLRTNVLGTLCVQKNTDIVAWEKASLFFFGGGEES